MAKDKEADKETPVSESTGVAGETLPAGTVPVAEARAQLNPDAPHEAPISPDAPVIHPTRTPGLPTPPTANTGQQPVSVVPVNVPTANNPAFANLPRLGDGSARGETQPGIPAPGVNERVIEQGELDRLAAGSEESQPEAVRIENGQLRIGSKMFNVATLSETDLGQPGVKGKDFVTITTSTGKNHKYEGETAAALRRVLS